MNNEQKEKVNEIKRELGKIRQFRNRCYVCHVSWHKRGMTFHHIKYKTNEKTHSNFPDGYAGTLQYYEYLKPIIKKKSKEICISLQSTSSDCNQTITIQQRQTRQDFQAGEEVKMISDKEEEMPTNEKKFSFFDDSDLEKITKPFCDEANEAAERIVKYGRPIIQIEKYLNSKIKDDPILVKQLLRVFLSAYTNEPINVGVLAPSSEGKTYATVEISEIFPLSS